MWILEVLWETGGRDPRIFKFRTDARVCSVSGLILFTSLEVSTGTLVWQATLHIQLVCALKNQLNIWINEVASFCRVGFELNVQTQWVVQQCNNVLQTFVKSAFVQYTPSVKRNCKTMEGGVHSGKDTNYLRCENQSVLQPPAIVYALI